MALEGFTLGSGTKQKQPAQSAPAAAPTGTALKGFSVGTKKPAATKTPAKPVSTVPAPGMPVKPAIDWNAINLTKPTPVDTSSAFSKSSLNMSKLNDSVVSSVKSKTVNPAPQMQPGLQSRQAEISAPKKQGVASKAYNALQNFFIKESADHDAISSAVQKSIVDTNLVEIGRKLGLDAKFPVDPNRDASVQKTYQDKQIADYLRTNWDDIRWSTANTDTLPIHPEMLGPGFEDVSKNLDTYTKALGLRSTPTNMEVITYALMAPVAAALIEAPVAAGIGLAAFTALSEAEHYFLGDTAANKIADTLGANGRTRDALNLVELFAIGKALHVGYKKSPEIMEKWTKNIVTEYLPGQVIKFEPAKIRSALTEGLSRGEISKAEMEIITATVGKGGGKSWREALKNGTTIEVAPEKVLRLVDKGYWAKIKDTLNTGLKAVKLPEIKPTNKIISRTPLAETKASSPAEIFKIEGKKPNLLLGSGGAKKVAGIADTLRAEIQTSVKKNGRAATQLALQENLKMDAVTAGRVMSDALRAPREKVLKDLKDTVKVTPLKVTDGGEKAVVQIVKKQGGIGAKRINQYADKIAKLSGAKKTDANHVREASVYTTESGMRNANSVAKNQLFGKKNAGIEAHLRAKQIGVHGLEKDLPKALESIRAKAKKLDKKAASFLKAWIEKNFEGEDLSMADVKAIEAMLKKVKGSTFTDLAKHLKKPKPKAEKKAPEKKEPEPTKEEKAIDTFVETGKVKADLKPIGTGEKKISKLAEGVEAKAIEKKLTEDLGELPQYNKVSMSEQAALATELLDTNPELALRVALGEELPPEGILPESIFVAVETRALERGDIETLRRLATESSLSTEATAMGQRIRALGEREPDSPVAKIKEIVKAREANFEKRTGKTVKQAVKEEVKKMKEIVKKSSPTKQTWEEFVNSIECGY